MSILDIATHLDRDPASVESYVKDKIGNTTLDDREIEALHDLQNRPFWKDLEKQFSEEELQSLLYHWGRIITQFRDDVLPTEELQIIDAIKLEILMNRALIGQQDNMRSIDQFQDAVTVEKNKDLELQDKDYIYNLERQIAVCRAAQDSLTRDYKDLQTKKAAMLKDLKATREQRIKRLEDSKQTFIGWVRNLMSNPDTRREMGIEMEKMRLAMKQEEKRLSEYHQYEDGGIDQPFLTPDTVKDD
jgi:tRNA G10  N-methylase Trm11